MPLNLIFSGQKSKFKIAAKVNIGFPDAWSPAELFLAGSLDWSCFSCFQACPNLLLIGELCVRLAFLQQHKIVYTCLNYNASSYRTRPVWYVPPFYLTLEGTDIQIITILILNRISRHLEAWSTRSAALAPPARHYSSFRVFKLQSSQQCVCVYVLWCFSSSPAQIPVVPGVPGPESPPFVFTTRHTALKCLPGVLITISSHVIAQKRAVAVVIFHVSPSGTQVWSSHWCLCCSGWCLTPDIDTTSKQLTSPQQVNH